MTKDQTDPWREILREAIALGVQRGGPVPGSKLRMLVSKVATNHGLSYPPVEWSETSFAQFLRNYADTVTVRFRPKQDVLVAPIERPELLTEVTPSGPLPGIRTDLFTAFTRLSGTDRSWYVPEEDRVQSLKSTLPPESETWVAIPQAALEQAIAVRRDFAKSLSDEAVRGMFLNALNSPKPLAEFTNAIRSSRRQREWHKYRTAAVVDSIKAWAQSANLQWRDTWITTPSGESVESDGERNLSNVPSSEWRRAMASFLQTLSEEDTSRISVPLDIVIKSYLKR